MDGARIARMRMRAQRLWGPGFDDPQDAVGWLTAVQAQDFRYAKWSVAQRTKQTDSTTVDRAFDAGRILRTHMLRPTWHFVAPQDLRWLMQLSGPRVNAVNARRYRELGLDAEVLARANDVIAEAVSSRPLTRRELGGILERRRISTQGQRIAYILMRAELEAVICSGPMKGKQHTYGAFDDRVPGGDARERDEALAELAGRFFAARGPATLQDFAWWSGLGMRDARRGLEAAKSGLEQRLVDGRTYWFAEGATRRSPREPKVDLVQCYDESIISYTESRDVLQTPTVSFPVPRNLDGFVHVILCDGRLLGHWRLGRGRGDPPIQTRVGRRLDKLERLALADALDRYQRFLAVP